MLLLFRLIIILIFRLFQIARKVKFMSVCGKPLAKAYAMFGNFFKKKTKKNKHKASTNKQNK